MLPNIGYEANSVFERDALKPKYPTEALHAKCASPFELRGCIEALHKAGVPVSMESMTGSDDATHPNIGWIGGSVVQFTKEPYCREIPLSEFMDIFLKPEPKPEAPKILDREYRVTGNGGPAHAFGIGSVVHLIGEIDGSGYFTGQFEGNDCRQLVNMNCVELLPEKPWWTAYKEGDEVWVKGTIGGVELEDCEDGQPLRVDFDDYELWLTEKDEIKKA